MLMKLTLPDGRGHTKLFVVEPNTGGLGFVKLSRTECADGFLNSGKEIESFCITEKELEHALEFVRFAREQNSKLGFK